MATQPLNIDTIAGETELRGCDGDCAECVATDLEEMIQSDRWDLTDLGRRFLREMRASEAGAQE